MDVFCSISNLYNENMTIIISIGVLALLWVITRLHDIEKEVKKGNKDSQEVKTRLTYIRRAIRKLEESPLLKYGFTEEDIEEMINDGRWK